MTDSRQYILDRVYMCPVSGCWIWALCSRRASDREYGAASKNGKVCFAHRLSYEAFVGEIPDGLQIDHLCKTTLCCNPDHLEAVTGAVNIRRSDAAKNAGIHYASKTHCPNGHEYNEENTYVFYRTRNGRTAKQRTCRVCHLEHSRASYKRKRG